MARCRHALRPLLEPCEGRALLSVTPFGRALASTHTRPLAMSEVSHPIRPNTPVLPFGAPAGNATFIDPSTQIIAGRRIGMRPLSYVAPFAKLNAQGGLIKVGRASSILDNAKLIANPNQALSGNPLLSIGDLVVVAQGATVLGPSRVGAFDLAASPTYIGPGAVVDNATIEPGAFVAERATVTPGLTIRSGLAVLPGVVVRNQAEASDPALGKVAPITAAQQAQVQQLLGDDLNLAAGYITLYQGNRATGASPGTALTTIFNGDLSTVTGVSANPASPATPFPSRSPSFPAPHRPAVRANLPLRHARVVGDVRFTEQRAGIVTHRIGNDASIRADLGQPIVFGTINRIGQETSIVAPRGGMLAAGNELTVGNRVVILGGANAAIGDRVTINDGAIVENSRIGSGATIGAGAVVRNATIAPGASVPPGAIVIG
jgi:carbonic anhydrase/acetyltransferase-like protein (isoleucine patch superfamily)